MPAAIRFATCVAAAPNDTGEFRCASLQQEQLANFPASDRSPAPRHDWTDYTVTGGRGGEARQARKEEKEEKDEPGKGRHHQGEGHEDDEDDDD